MSVHHSIWQIGGKNRKKEIPGPLTHDTSSWLVVDFPVLFGLV